MCACIRVYVRMCIYGSFEYVGDFWAIRDLIGYYCGNKEGVVFWG